MNQRFIKMTFAILVCGISTGLASCSGEEDSTLPDTPTELTDEGYQGVKNPIQTAIGTKENEVTWSCIKFGAYPANEVVSSSFDAVDRYAVREGDVIRDATLYEKLAKAVWTDDETEMNGRRYRRINGKGAKRFRCTLYAKCRGAWWSSVDAYRATHSG